MIYQNTDINTRINLKANRIIIYGRPSIKPLIARMVNRSVGLDESRFGMMTQPEQFKDPRNAGHQTY